MAVPATPIILFGEVGKLLAGRNLQETPRPESNGERFDAQVNRRARRATAGAVCAEN